MVEASNAPHIPLFYWAIAMWWISMLLVLGVWRYLICSVPLAYDPLYWGGVFPLGMYSVSTYHVAKIMAAPFLLPLSQLFMVAAVLAWAATFAGWRHKARGRALRVIVGTWRLGRRAPKNRFARSSRGR
jgi:tellurite resistance protein TehA-like permease